MVSLRVWMLALGLADRSSGGGVALLHALECPGMAPACPWQEDIVPESLREPEDNTRIRKKRI